MEDQMGEDFFDKLVDDDSNGFAGCGPSFIEHEVTEEAKSFSNLCIGDNVNSGDNGERESGGGVVSKSLDSHRDIVTAEGSVLVAPDNVVQSSDAALEAIGELDLQKSRNGVTSGTGVKEVDWSSFNSASNSRFGSYSDFLNELGVSLGDLDRKDVVSVSEDMPCGFRSSTSVNHEEGGRYYGSQTEKAIDVQDLNSSQNWENLYPGWRYNPSTGQWHEIEGYGVTVSTQDNLYTSSTSAGDNAVTEQRSDAYCFQQPVAEYGTANVSNWNQCSKQKVEEYPTYMVFDPQYPGWYYDTIAQEWRLFESYMGVMTQPYKGVMTQPTNVSHNQQSQDSGSSTVHLLPAENHSIRENFGQIGKFESQGPSIQGQVSASDYNWQNRSTWQTASLPNSGVVEIIDNQVSHNPYAQTYRASNSADQQMWLPEQTRHIIGSAINISDQTCIPGVNFPEHSNQHKPEPSSPSPQVHVSPVYFGSQKSPDFSQPLQHGSQFPNASSEGRSSAGRPPHALVTFGFGGKLIVMKDNSSLTNSACGSKDSADGIISVLNLMDVVMDKTDASSIGFGACDYFHVLCQQSFPGPLVGGNVGSREVNKWVDEKIASCKSPDMEYRRGELLSLLFSLLKIGCQYRGKLRSPCGTDQALKESDCPELAVAQLFASAKRNVGPYGTFSRCLQNFPSEGEIQATAFEVQKLLISGRIKEALLCAQEGHLWGPALALAAQLGDKFYSDAVKQMALCQLVVGSPLRTVCLLIAGQPADVFSNGMCTSSLPGAILVAHICYLVAEVNFESYSDSARVCLIGADHWNFPRTYASPEAIQRTELYEYSKVLGNSQFIVPPFQPYKLIYAHMLAEVGKVSDSLKYCQAILKCLKTCRSPEVDAWKILVLSLEERIKIHQQGGYSSNLAPAKLVGKLLNLFDSTSNRVVGGLPPPVPSTSHSSSQRNEHDCQKVGPRVSNSQSTMAMSSLVPSASTEPISEWQGGSNRSRHNRSISEPDFGKSPMKSVLSLPEHSDFAFHGVDLSKDGSSPDMKGNTPGTGGSSRFGRFRTNLFQKTMGLVLRSRPDRQAKLGETNRFYYDEKLKRWVEEGAETPSEEATLPPPPRNAAFQNRMPDNSLKDGPNLEKLHSNDGSDHENQSPLELNFGKQPIPHSSDQFSARRRMGIRARYVDTFHKDDAAPPNLFRSPSLPAGKLGVGPNTKFFIPTPRALGDETVQTTEDLQEAAVNNKSPSTSDESNPFSSPPTSTSSTTTMHRVPSMDNIARSGTGALGNDKGSLPPHSRRTVSWSGSFCDPSNPSNGTEIKPLGEVMPQPLLMPGNSSSMQLSSCCLESY
ncbi:hypothetical protein RHGRI_019268 [Rhododendron griersonianum]|uniref:Protein transport protein sec16 n=1 Tax=Rhododendron griersonianum TaxID=479676 RepID=A0AAV6JBW2_9ERIC|nr:hypothetical protein RHGRI_019268 [Rhododendron griersonianum]